MFHVENGPSRFHLFLQIATAKKQYQLQAKVIMSDSEFYAKSESHFSDKLR